MRRRSHTVKALVLALVATLALSASAFAVVPDPGPQSGSTGLEGKISSPPPKTAPTISTPSSGQTFTQIPITVSGLCSALTVKIFDNNIFVGAAQCSNGSYQLKVDLFSGKNVLVARQYDALDQQSPPSNKVSVNFQDAQFAQFGTRVTLSSPYARKGAAPGDVLTWPIIISGGIGPYAISVDWGDNTAPEVLSVDSAGQVTIKHTYESAGVYTVIVRASDKNGTVAFLQLIGVGTGKITGDNGTKQPTKTVVITKIIWWPMLILFVLMIAAFFVGRRQQLGAIRRQIEKSRRE